MGMGGMGMGMTSWEWEGMGTVKVILAHLYNLHVTKALLLLATDSDVGEVSLHAAFRLSSGSARVADSSYQTTRIDCFCCCC